MNLATPGYLYIVYQDPYGIHYSWMIPVSTEFNIERTLYVRVLIFCWTLEYEMAKQLNTVYFTCLFYFACNNKIVIFWADVRNLISKQLFLNLFPSNIWTCLFKVPFHDLKGDQINSIISPPSPTLSSTNPPSPPPIHFTPWKLRFWYQKKPHIFPITVVKF